MLPSTPVPDDAERMHKYITDRRVIGVCRRLPDCSCTLCSSGLYAPTFTVTAPASVLPLSNVQYDPLIQPALIRHEITSSSTSQATIAQARFTASRIIQGQDDRLIVIVGPCSIHNPEQALEYARMLKEEIPKHDGLLIIMRAYL